MTETVLPYADKYASMPDSDLWYLSFDVERLVPEAREALRAELELRHYPVDGINWTAKLLSPEVDEPLAMVRARAYRWGKFQGYFLLFSGVLGIVLLALRTQSDVWGRAGYYTGIAYCLYVGYGLAKKRRLALRLYYVACAIDVIVILLSRPSRVLSATILSFWILPAIFYYPRRWSEFS